MKRIVSTLLLMFICATALWSQKLYFSLDSDTSALRIGEQVALWLKAELPAGEKYRWPSLPDTIAGLEIVSIGSIDSAMANGEVLRVQQEIRITSFDSGYVVIPALWFFGESDSTQSQRLVLSVIMPELSEERDYYDLKAVESVPRNWWLVAAYILAALLLLLLILFVIRHFMKKGKADKVEQSVPALPANQWALQELNWLAAKELWQKGAVKQYYSELFDIFRQYLEREFALKAMESTAEELIAELPTLGLPREMQSQLTKSLRQSDFVKFAKQNPSAAENERALQVVYAVIHHRQSESEEKEREES